ncbi:phosphotransferase system, enzyme I, PtsI [Nannocystis exedens]|uniref:Phosphoenolpyruvate-protein phosphotransferase n=1 Tax=Nannocystis exedens TaxID=54 RepID=A0A1I1W9K2_9BACT|nr:phosphoenolpyruvate--protein phosphotransferase [Nannocystis exedens]PCC67544.1 Phosphoenolpyruvate-protein phosphotransferase [Nannocystis exedens]SFD91721.1 phosphotransferase system, enzyme I, PtsI [Nannocystis exedens]
MNDGAESAAFSGLFRQADLGLRREMDGAAASPGVGIGPAYVVDRRRVHVLHTHIDRDRVEAEIERLHEALRACRQQIEVVKSRLPHGEHRQILKAQQMILRDPDLIQRTETLIREELANAEWALTTVTDQILEVLGNADDNYFRERGSDLTYLIENVLQALLGEHGDEIDPPAGSVVVAQDLSPADTARMHRCQVAGLVTGVGGKTSHSAIMARSLQIPAVVGVDDVLAAVDAGDLIVVDAVRGRIIVRPTPEEVAHFQAERERHLAFEQKIRKEHAFPAVSLDGLHVRVRANIAISEELDLALRHGAEGVGLYRSEYMFMNRDTLPSEEEHYRMAKHVLRRCAPYTVVFRTFDLGADKPTKLLELEDERNPAMGMRSLRLALRERDMFLAQLRGFLRAGVHGPLAIMLPLVGGVDELGAGLDAIEEARDQLATAGVAHADDIDIGVMIETPAAALTAEHFARRVDFLSIGTNDLIQYTLAIDRENEAVSYLYQPMHPAILRLIKEVAEAGARNHVPVSLCGEMAADPRYTWVLLGLGVAELSMHPSAIPVIKHIIRSSKTDDMKELAERVLKVDSASEADELVLATMRARFPEHLRHGCSEGEGGP